MSIGVRCLVQRCEITGNVLNHMRSEGPLPVTRRYVGYTALIEILL